MREIVGYSRVACETDLQARLEMDSIAGGRWVKGANVDYSQKCPKYGSNNWTYVDHGDQLGRELGVYTCNECNIKW